MTTTHPVSTALRSALTTLVLLAFAAVPATAANCVWTGTGVDNNFSTLGNWSDFPDPGDDLEFPAGVWSLTNTPVNDMTGMVVNAINIYEKYVITGNPVFCQIINVHNPGITNVGLPLASVGSAVITITVLSGTLIEGVPAVLASCV